MRTGKGRTIEEIDNRMLTECASSQSIFIVWKRSSLYDEKMPELDG